MLNEKKSYLLKFVVEQYILKGSPISSSSYTDYKTNEKNLKSSTIRKLMNDLEHEGFLEKKNNVSGRIPSTSGYKYYVNNIMTPDKELLNIKLKLNNILNNRLLSIDDVIKSSCKIISEGTSLALLIHEEISLDVLVKKVDLVRISNNEMIFLFILSSGKIINKSINLDNNENTSDLSQCIEFLNKYLIDCPLANIQQKLKELKPIATQFYFEHEMTIHSLINLIFSNFKPQNNLSGLSNIRERKEFFDYKKFNYVVELLEKKSIWKIVAAMQAKNNSKKINIKIGEEISNDFKDMAAISSQYKNKKHQKFGYITLLGPKRIEYKDIYELLNWFINKLERI